MKGLSRLGGPNAHRSGPVYEARKRSGLCISRFAGKLKCSPETVSRVELQGTGFYEPRLVANLARWEATARGETNVGEMEQPKPVRKGPRITALPPDAKLQRARQLLEDMDHRVRTECPSCGKAGSARREIESEKHAFHQVTCECGCSGGKVYERYWAHATESQRETEYHVCRYEAWRIWSRLGGQPEPREGND